jgi:hypothetical protein
MSMFPGDSDGDLLGGRLCDPTRRMVPISVLVDNPDALSQTLACRVNDRALTLLVSRYNNFTGTVVECERQAGLVRCDPQSSPQVVTAMNTLVSEENKSGQMETVETASLLSSRGDTMKVSFPGLLGWKLTEETKVPLTDGVSWKYGVDVAWGDKAENPNNPVVRNVRPFDLVRQDFQYAPGQKVGIAVYSREGATAESAEAEGVSEERIRAIFGNPNEVIVYTGSIIAVGPKHIEFDVNTFFGCTGAIIFLLDKNQPTDSVKKEDHGKAIAVNAGSCDELVNNVGFKLYRNP